MPTAVPTRLSSDLGGPAAHSLTFEQGSNGLCRATAHWFEGRELRDFRSDWHDEQRDAVASVYDQYRATMTARQWAALAARSDFERMRSWRSEEHTSELQSLMRTSYAVFCLKKKNTDYNTRYNQI